MGQQISQANIFYLLDLVDKYDCKELAAQCGGFLASNFAPILAENKKRVLSLPVETWVAMLKSDDLLVATEHELFDTVMQYVTPFDQPKKKAALEQLLPHIRWCYMPMKYLSQTIEKDKFLCSLSCLPALLFETYRYKVREKTLWHTYAHTPYSLHIGLSAECTEKL